MKEIFTNYMSLYQISSRTQDIRKCRISGPCLGTVRHGSSTPPAWESCGTLGLQNDLPAAEWPRMHRDIGPPAAVTPPRC